VFAQGVYMSNVVDAFKKHEIDISAIKSGVVGLPLFESPQEQGRYEALELVFQSMLVDKHASKDLRSTIFCVLYWYPINPRFEMSLSSDKDIQDTLRVLKFLNEVMTDSFAGFKFDLIHGEGEWKNGELVAVECQLIWLDNPNVTYKDKDVDE
jgi:hypothetical protein